MGKETITWQEGTVQDFFELTDAQAAVVEVRARLAIAMTEQRRARKLSQEKAAEILGTGQARVSKMEHGLEGSLDTMVGSLVALGLSLEDIGAAIAGAPARGAKTVRPKVAAARKRAV